MWNFPAFISWSGPHHMI